MNILEMAITHLSQRWHPVTDLRKVLLGIVFAAMPAWATSYPPPDKRTWEQVTTDFAASEGTTANDGQYDGRRLKELDARRAAGFLISCLAKGKPDGVRTRAIGALGWESFQEAIPAISAIALDETENGWTREAALNPGLRYMHHPDAVKTATKLANHPLASIRRAAYWVLSEHGTDAAVKLLSARLQVKDPAELQTLIWALTFSKHRDAGKLIFENTTFANLPADEDHRHAYACAMYKYDIEQAQESMLVLARQPDQPLSCYYALKYLGHHPRQEAAAALIAYIEKRPFGNEFYRAVTAFIGSPKIDNETKARLAGLLFSNKVREGEEVLGVAE